jgi:hypothetical protein
MHSRPTPAWSLCMPGKSESAHSCHEGRKQQVAAGHVASLAPKDCSDILASLTGGYLADLPTGNRRCSLINRQKLRLAVLHFVCTIPFVRPRERELE